MPAVFGVMAEANMASSSKLTSDPLWHFMDCFDPSEMQIVHQLAVQMWREVQIYKAIEKALATKNIVSEAVILKMLRDRPRTDPTPWMRFNSESDVPSDFVGHMNIGGKWFRDS